MGVGEYFGSSVNSGDVLIRRKGVSGDCGDFVRNARIMTYTIANIAHILPTMTAITIVAEEFVIVVVVVTLVSLFIGGSSGGSSGGEGGGCSSSSSSSGSGSSNRSHTVTIVVMAMNTTPIAFHGSRRIYTLLAHYPPLLQHNIARLRL